MGNAAGWQLALTCTTIDPHNPMPALPTSTAVVEYARNRNWLRLVGTERAALVNNTAASPCGASSASAKNCGRRKLAYANDAVGRRPWTQEVSAESGRQPLESVAIVKNSAQAKQWSVQEERCAGRPGKQLRPIGCVPTWRCTSLDFDLPLNDMPRILSALGAGPPLLSYGRHGQLRCRCETNFASHKRQRNMLDQHFFNLRTPYPESRVARPSQERGRDKPQDMRKSKYPLRIPKEARLGRYPRHRRERQPQPAYYDNPGAQPNSQSVKATTCPFELRAKPRHLQELLHWGLAVQAATPAWHEHGKAGRPKPQRCSHLFLRTKQAATPWSIEPESTKALRPSLEYAKRPSRLDTQRPIPLTSRRLANAPPRKSLRLARGNMRNNLATHAMTPTQRSCCGHAVSSADLRDAAQHERKAYRARTDAHSEACGGAAEGHGSYSQSSNVQHAPTTSM